MATSHLTKWFHAMLRLSSKWCVRDSDKDAMHQIDAATLPRSATARPSWMHPLEPRKLLGRPSVTSQLFLTKTTPLHSQCLPGKTRTSLMLMDGNDAIKLQRLSFVCVGEVVKIQHSAPACKSLACTTVMGLHTMLCTSHMLARQQHQSKEASSWSPLSEQSSSA